MGICRLLLDILLFWRIYPILLSYSPPHYSKLPSPWYIGRTRSLFGNISELEKGPMVETASLSEFSVDSQELWGAWRPFSQISSFLRSESMRSCRGRSPERRGWGFNQWIQCISLTVRTLHAAERHTSPATASRSLVMSPDDLGGPGSQMQDPN